MNDRESGKRRSGIYVLPARHDADDIYIYIYIHIYIYIYGRLTWLTIKYGDQKGNYCLYQGHQKISSGDLTWRPALIYQWSQNEKFRKQEIKKKINMWKILIQFSYRYEWTVTDIMSRGHKIIIIPNMGRTIPFG